MQIAAAILFIFVSLITWMLAALVSLLPCSLKCTIPVLILYRNKITNLLESNIATILQHLFVDIWHQFLKVPLAIINAMSPPLVTMFSYIARFEINLTSTMGITCPGAAAPVRLLFNLVVLGLGIIIVESDFQILKSLAYFPLGMHSLRMQAHPVFLQWYLQRNGDTWWRRMGYFMYVFSCYILQKLTNIDFFQKGLLYMFSLVVFQAYDVVNTYERDLNRSDACDNIPGWEGMDSDILVATSVVAYFILIPGLYVLSNMLMPGIRGTSTY